LGWMGISDKVKRVPILGGYICRKWGIATFWGKSVVRGKIVSSPSGVLLMSPPAIYLTTTLTHIHTTTRLPIMQSTNETIEPRNTTTSADVCLCLCVSVMFVYFVKTNKHIFKSFSPSGSHTILVFKRLTLR